MVLCLGEGLSLIINLGLAGSGPALRARSWCCWKWRPASLLPQFHLGLSIGSFSAGSDEDSIAHTAAGLVEGLACAATVTYSLSGDIEAKHLHAFLLLGAIGAVTGSTFWRLARALRKAD
jgi:hypothetical protein